MEIRQLGPYKIGKVIGRGGMGAVYEAVHQDTGAAAAVKVLLSALEEDLDVRQRFELEINALKQLHHPNIVRLFGFGEEQGFLYYVMELVNGPSLQHELKKQRLFTWQETAKIGLDICLAFRHAHDRGITHRDIKPANILLTQDGSVKLSDYGIAQNFGMSRITGTHSIVGTLEYMSPEQAAANPVGPRSDLFSLGTVLYLLLTGSLPFSARSLPELIRKHSIGSYASIKAARFDVPADFEAIIADLMRILPEERPANAYLAAKRFQAMLHALVGPPETLRVLPMMPSAPPVQPPLNFRRSQSHDDHSSHGFIVDLAGINYSSNVAKPNQQAAVTVMHSESPQVSEEPGIATIEFTPTDRQDAGLRQPPFSDKQTGTEAVSNGVIRHGEVLLMETAEIRQSKDEPLPSIKSFDYPVAETSNKNTDKAAGTADSPPSSISVDKTTLVPKTRGAAAAAVPLAADSIFLPAEDSVQTKAGKLPTVSSFVEVTDGHSPGLSSEHSVVKTVISLSTVLTSLALLIIGITVYYLLQPVPPDKLYARIKAVLELDNSNGGGYSLSTLRAAQNNIEQFLADYPRHPLADQIQELHDELELAENERRYTRQQFLSSVKRLSPVEIAYMEAITVSKTDLAAGAVKLKAFIDLFDDGAVKESETSAKAKRLSSLVEICVELAKRRLQKIEHELSLQSAEQTEVIRQRLREADASDKTNSARAEAIRKAVIVLYKEYAWAKELVDEARQKSGK
ncbi:MAG: serine/threonine protein kinase [Planctomycetaceae bacterium]|nr:serine/threonine protein kinase [Planctomycetaceae bacterium]